MSGMGSRIFFRTSSVPSITYILAIKIGWAVFEKIWFFHFSTFSYNFCKKIFFELILGVNSSCSGSHSSSQYGSNLSGTPRPCLSCYGLWVIFGISFKEKYSIKCFGKLRNYLAIFDLYYIVFFIEKYWDPSNLCAAFRGAKKKSVSLPTKWSFFLFQIVNFHPIKNILRHCRVTIFNRTQYKFQVNRIIAL